ncbi:UNVERIFIED_CONTAM: hypothetical protein Sradi_7295800 [Sesamum radiatum]|uniref:Uncharacterized protein n=1 Tax=Sesamum radiatum TaxID=300843 RepID=A0AAW2IIR9_SESRA
MNVALMLKQVWRIIQEEPTSIWVAWVRRYRLRNQTLWTVNTVSASWCWRKLVKASLLLKEGLVYRVGDGLKFRLWTDLWHPRGPLIKQFLGTDNYGAAGRLMACDSHSPRAMVLAVCVRFRYPEHNG